MRPSPEKEFFLTEFRGRTLAIGVDRECLDTTRRRRHLAAVVEDLLDHGSRVLLVVGGAVSGFPRGGKSVRDWLRLPAARAGKGRDLVWSPVRSADMLGSLWRSLRRDPLVVLRSADAALGAAAAVAAGLRVHKLAVIDERGGMREASGARPLSFLDETRLERLLQRGAGDPRGARIRRDLLTRVDEVLRAGVRSINLCRVEELGRELFTYEGAGTVFTRDEYCHVERLCIDDFPEVERLVRRGQREGLLKPRTPTELGEILLGGFGAWLGTRHLAGVAALRTEPYREAGAGELAALYAITRFQGEGLGYRLVDRVRDEARSRGLAYLFAVTTAEPAAVFFARAGLREAGVGDVPESKWDGYDPARRRRARVFRQDL